MTDELPKKKGRPFLSSKSPTARFTVRMPEDLRVQMREWLDGDGDSEKVRNAVEGEIRRSKARCRKQAKSASG